MAFGRDQRNLPHGVGRLSWGILIRKYRFADGAQLMRLRLTPPLTVFLALFLAACSPAGGAPSIPVFGSFFPAWIICAFGGVIVAMAFRMAFVALRLDEHLPAPPLVYLCLAVSGGIVFWMIWAGAL